jgi:hypothetical protein
VPLDSSQQCYPHMRCVDPAATLWFRNNRVSGLLVDIGYRAFTTVSGWLDVTRTGGESRPEYGRVDPRAERGRVFQRQHRNRHQWRLRYPHRREHR